jgi:hypothetical protein
MIDEAPHPGLPPGNGAAAVIQSRCVVWSAPPAGVKIVEIDPLTEIPSEQNEAKLESTQAESSNDASSIGGGQQRARFRPG